MKTDEQFLLEEKYGGTLSPEYEHDRTRLTAGEPLDYVIGWKPFLGTKIALTSRPLIPRPETEYWVECAISDMQERSDGKLSVLDLFAGSGAIGVAVLKNIPNAFVEFGEIDEHHFSTIRGNIIENGIDEDRTKITKTDVWSSMQGPYDFILTNPPYLSEERIERIEASVLAHEPARALFAEDGGFALIERLIAGAPVHLAKSGSLYIEHEPEHEERIHTAATEHGLLAESFRDQFGVVRFSILKTSP